VISTIQCGHFCTCCLNLADQNLPLCDIFKGAFIWSFIDTTAKGQAIREFNKLEQKGEEIDNYIAQFNNLTAQLQYDWESHLLTKWFCKGLNKGVHNDIKNMDIWPETLD
jgi:hypothetical protein